MKPLGAAVFLVASWGLARIVASPYRRRVRALEDWFYLLGHLGSLIGWRQLPLAAAFIEAVRTYPLRQPVAQRLHDLLSHRDEDFGTSFAQALETDGDLWPADRAVLERLGRELGRASVEYEEQNIAHAREEIGRLLGQARQADLKHARLLESLVSMAGVAVVILLI